MKYFPGSHDQGRGKTGKLDPAVKAAGRQESWMAMGIKVR